MKNYVLQKVLLIMVLFLNTSLLSASSGIYKCVSNDGTTIFVDKPCPIEDKETEFKAIKDPINGYIAPEYISNSETKRTYNLNGYNSTLDNKESMRNEKSENANISNKNGDNYSISNKSESENKNDSAVNNGVIVNKDSSNASLQLEINQPTKKEVEREM